PSNQIPPGDLDERAARGKRGARLSWSWQNFQAANRERARRPGMDGADPYPPAQRLLEASPDIDRQLPANRLMQRVAARCRPAEGDAKRHQPPATSPPPQRL